MPLTGEQLLGLDGTHVVALDPAWCVGPVLLHPRAGEAFERLRGDAAAEGFDLRIASGYRSFHRQAEIWNGKARGERVLLDAEERPLDVRSLDEPRALEAILRWSALPGCSRHHWGTDLDLVDAAALTPGAPPRLLAADWAHGGCFAALDRWLASRIAEGNAAGFFRPYTGYGCAVAAEPWHLSYAPLAVQCQAALDRVALRKALHAAGLELLVAVEARLDDILARYVQVPALLYPAPMMELTADTRQ